MYIFSGGKSLPGSLSWAERDVQREDKARIRISINFVLYLAVDILNLNTPP
jgi:hypothetical protein